jgi:hypothetical protein
MIRLIHPLSIHRSGIYLRSYCKRLNVQYYTNHLVTPQQVNSLHPFPCFKLINDTYQKQGSEERLLSSDGLSEDCREGVVKRHRQLSSHSILTSMTHSIHECRKCPRLQWGTEREGEGEWSSGAASGTQSSEELRLTSVYDVEIVSMTRDVVLV